MSKSLVLIASYPKSGNTWTRIVLERLRKSGLKHVSINNLEGAWTGIMLRRLFDDFSPVNAADLTWAETDFFLPGAFRQLAEESQDRIFVKVHDTLRMTALGSWLYPVESVYSVVYLVRHPFDVAVSTANHLGTSIESAVELMAKDTFPVPLHELPPTPPQFFGSWSHNVLSWLDSPFPREIARYEDMHAGPVPVFARLAKIAGLTVSEDEVRRAVQTSQFEQLQKEEQKKGFRERPDSSPQFFRAGRPGSWKGVLSEALQRRLLRDHEAVMTRLGYLPDGSAAPLEIRDGCPA
ncbi:MAG: sulfotransferase domain-containing protein [Rhizomicrobium sp.]|jgi:hypothetical protein